MASLPRSKFLLPRTSRQPTAIERKTNMSVLIYLVLTAAVFAALGLTLKAGS
jgi:hypothetical protein